MTKSELIEHVSDKLKLPNGVAAQIVNCIFDSMIHALRDGEGIEIRGFGSFTVREYKAYEGRNPRTGETVHVAPKRLPFFKVGKDLRERVNLSLKADSSSKTSLSSGVPEAFESAVTTPYKTDGAQTKRHVRQPSFVVATKPPKS